MRRAIEETAPKALRSVHCADQAAAPPAADRSELRSHERAVGAVSWVACLRCKGAGWLAGDDCPACCGSGRVDAPPDPRPLPVHPYALERVECSLRSCLLRSRVLGADQLARSLARALTACPIGGDPLPIVRMATGCGAPTCCAIVRCAVDALCEHGRAIVARDRYSRERLPGSQEQKRKLDEIAERLELALPWHERRPELFE